MTKPTSRELQDIGDITQAYASMILAGKREPSRALAVKIYKETGWKVPRIAHMSADEIAAVGKLEGVA